MMIKNLNASRIFLFIVAALYATHSILALIDPVGMLSKFDVDVSGRHGSFELRGMYGGVFLAAALLMASAALKFQSLIKPALWVVVVFTGGFVFGRIVASVIEGLPESSFFPAMVMELLLCLCASFCLRREYVCDDG